MKGTNVFPANAHNQIDPLASLRPWLQTLGYMQSRYEEPTQQFIDEAIVEPVLDTLDRLNTRRQRILVALMRAALLAGTATELTHMAVNYLPFV